MLPIKKTIRILCISVCMLPGLGCKAEQESDKLAKELETLIYTDGTSVAAESPGGAAILAQRVKAKGVDLYRVYSNARSQSTKIGAVYLMLLNENAEYAEHLEHDQQAGISKEEIRVCAYVLCHPRAKISEAYTERTLDALAEYNNPSIILCRAQLHLDNKDYRDSASEALKVVSSPNRETWTNNMYWVLERILVSKKGTVLQNYLKTESCEGVHVAYVLAQNEAYKSRAISYLTSASKSTDTRIAGEAESILEEIKTLKRDKKKLKEMEDELRRKGYKIRQAS